MSNTSMYVEPFRPTYTPTYQLNYIHFRHVGYTLKVHPYTSQTSLPIFASVRALFHLGYTLIYTLQGFNALVSFQTFKWNSTFIPAILHLHFGSTWVSPGLHFPLLLVEIKQIIFSHLIVLCILPTNNSIARPWQACTAPSRMDPNSTFTAGLCWVQIPI